MPRAPALTRHLRGLPPSPVARLEEALRFRTVGDPAGEERSLHAALRAAAPDAHADAQAARAAQLRLALLLCQTGRPAAADIHLARLGYGVRLGNGLFDWSRSPTAANGHNVVDNTAAVEDGVNIFDDAVRPEMLTRLRQALETADRPFWAEHDYPAANFFSYAYDLSTAPATAVEELIMQLRPLVERTYPQHAAGLHSAEWWVHSKSADHWWGHPLHYDLDEHGLDAGAGFRHPAVSTVVYLTEPRSGAFGPTAILNQCLGGPRATRASLIFPRLGRVCFFDGRLLHGVVAGKPWQPAPAAQANHGLRRLTLMIGWWKGPSLSGALLPATPYEAAGPKVLGSNMRAPAPDDMNWLWPKTMPTLGVRWGARQVDAAKLSQPLVVTPAWHDVDQASAVEDASCIVQKTAAERESCETDDGFGLGFLRGDHQIDAEAHIRLAQARTQVVSM